jgi:hypothetical protein
MPFFRPLLATAALLLAARAGAQSTTAAAPGTAPALPYIQSIALNPLVIPFGVFSGEYEAALSSPGFTIGVGGTYYSNDDRRDAWAELKGLYYPNESAFRGFSVGLSAGFHSTRKDVSSLCDGIVFQCTTTRKSQTAPTLGVLASYDWLLGRQERFRVGVGFGAKRVLKQVHNGDPLDPVYPDGRFVIGVVF